MQTCSAKTHLVYVLKDISASSVSDAVTMGFFCRLVPRPAKQPLHVHVHVSCQDSTIKCSWTVCLRMCHHSPDLINTQSSDAKGWTKYMYMRTVATYHRVPLIPPKRCCHTSVTRSLIRCDSQFLWRHRHVSSKRPLVASCHDNQ